MKMDFINMSAVLNNADRKLQSYITNADFYMVASESFREMGGFRYLSASAVLECADLRDYYAALARCELNAARSLISWLQEMDLIDIEDWSVMNHTLMWMGTSIPEDRS